MVSKAWLIFGIKKMVTLAFTSFLALFGVYLLNIFSAARHNVFWKLNITPSVNIDVYGAMVPALIGFCAVALHIIYFKASARKFMTGLLLSISVAFVFSLPTPRGIVVSILPFAFTVSLIAALVSFLKHQPLISKNSLGSEGAKITWRSYVAAMFAALAYGPLPVFVVDLVWIPFYTFHLGGSLYIGGAGLNDGILLSCLYVPFFLTFWASLFCLFIQLKHLLQDLIVQNRAISGCRANYENHS
jgi:hypothetical protein